MATTYQLLNVTSEEKTKKSKTKTNIHARKKMKQLTDWAIIIRRGGWEMGEICPKTKSYLPLIKQKLISTPAPHIMIILRLTPPSPGPWKKVSSH